MKEHVYKEREQQQRIDKTCKAIIHVNEMSDRETARTLIYRLVGDLHAALNEKIIVAATAKEKDKVQAKLKEIKATADLKSVQKVVFTFDTKEEPF